MTAEEKVAILHARMKIRQRRREKQILAALSTASTGLFLCLILLIFGSESAHYAGTAGVYSGAMMLFGGAGSYVLTAIIAFMAGVIITVLCIRYRRRIGAKNHPQVSLTEGGNQDKI